MDGFALSQYFPVEGGYHSDGVPITWESLDFHTKMILPLRRIHHKAKNNQYLSFTNGLVVWRLRSPPWFLPLTSECSFFACDLAGALHSECSKHTEFLCFSPSGLIMHSLNQCVYTSLFVVALCLEWGWESGRTSNVTGKYGVKKSDKEACDVLQIFFHQLFSFLSSLCLHLILLFRIHHQTQTGASFWACHCISTMGGSHQ